MFSAIITEMTLTHRLDHVLAFWKWCTVDFEPRHNEGPRDWQNLFAIIPEKSIGKFDLIGIDCIDQSVEIDDTLVSFIADLS